MATSFPNPLPLHPLPLPRVGIGTRSLDQQRRGRSPDSLAIGALHTLLGFEFQSFKFVGHLRDRSLHLQPLQVCLLRRG